jgi:hypothetical protein
MRTRLPEEGPDRWPSQFDQFQRSDDRRPEKRGEWAVPSGTTGGTGKTGGAGRRGWYFAGPGEQ